MSADNYWLIRQDRFGLFVPVMGSASDSRIPQIRLKDPRFTTIEAALSFVSDGYAEYGERVHPDCYETPRRRPEAANGHLLGCVQSDSEEFYAPEDWVCECDKLKNDWVTYVPPQDSPEPLC